MSPSTSSLPRGLCNLPSGTPEFQAKRTQETRGGGERGRCHGAETKDDIVIREDCCEHCMGAAVHF